MADDPGLSDQYGSASPWPLFVAVGFALAEVGVFMGIFPIAVGGVLLFGASVAGILRESGYVTRPWRLLAAIGLAFAALGALIAGTQIEPGAVVDAIAEPNGVAGRGLSIAVGGAILLAAGTAGALSGGRAA